MLTRSQASVLAALDRNAHGLCGSELVSLTDPKVGRGVVYAVLDQLVEGGWVREVEDVPTEEAPLARTRHFITDRGTRVLREHEAALRIASLGGSAAYQYCGD